MLEPYVSSTHTEEGIYASKQPTVRTTRLGNAETIDVVDDYQNVLI